MGNNFKELFGKASFDVKRELKKSELSKSSAYASAGERALYESVNKALRSDGCEEFGEPVFESYATDEMPVLFKDVKREIRRIFCKLDDVKETIGCHPDFTHLKDSQALENGYAVTMFFDIAGSTKMGKTYPPDKVFNFKNTVIRYVIEIIQAFDGHVHRIMGDAVMAFFRSHENAKLSREIDSAIDAVNAGIYILEFMEQVVRPELGDAGAEHPIGVRVGIDYAKENDIIWGNYGASGAFEVTATSYNVDVAAKLQQAAKTDSIMIGENLKALLGLGDEYLSVPFKYHKDESGNEFKRDYPYVIPNYRVRGEPINYKQYTIDNKKYFRFLPYGLEHSNIDVSLVASLGGPLLGIIVHVR
ncbi:adenylate/guanylate cyclase domain-containing protein [Dickeya fangzhongdai]|uniref:adenylate/guanylate cyclase domain-containing protein n=1 Tax=Dickeya fangzhongdai TaxID=1778540 RepID=UPI001F37E871|nr:adenylate/guanylate cyclase domain-containing protein [Dickeya fangzhongdai]UMB78465.1 adenylate/guanylate cyclase domain-containing protein [Dickeya fangzhongdai]